MDRNLKISDKLSVVYDDYYLNQQVLKKRKISGRQTIAHLSNILPRNKYTSCLDVGAGDGAVLQELESLCLAESLYAVEISKSGCEAIRQRNLKTLKSVEQFDGYVIDAAHDSYEIGLAIHVLEHVEYERVFLQEIARVCSCVYVEVPIELTFNVERSIKMASPYGHINYYTPATFRNMLNTSDLEVIEMKVYSNSLEYEVFMSGSIGGHFKYWMRVLLLKLAPKTAPFLMTYMAGALCRRTNFA